MVVIRGSDHVPAVVLEDKIMLYVITFLAGCMIGGLIGVFMMCGMIAAKEADDREERIHGKNNGGHL